jgi:hypothetical protein
LKQGKKPTRNQKIRIKEMGLNHENWLVVKDTPDMFQIVNRVSGKLRTKRKGEVI